MTPNPRAMNLTPGQRGAILFALVREIYASTPRSKEEAERRDARFAREIERQIENHGATIFNRIMALLDTFMVTTYLRPDLEALLSISQPEASCLPPCPTCGDIIERHQRLSLFDGEIDTRLCFGLHNEMIITSPRVLRELSRRMK